MADSDISLEPLFNQSTDGIGLNKRIAFVMVDLCGVASHRTPLTITNAAQEVAIGTSKRTIEFSNSGTRIIYYGGTGVTSSNGIPIFPNQVKSFGNVKDNFALSFVCDGAEISTLRIVEFT